MGHFGANLTNYAIFELTKHNYAIFTQVSQVYVIIEQTQVTKHIRDNLAYQS